MSLTEKQKEILRDWVDGVNTGEYQEPREFFWFFGNEYGSPVDSKTLDCLQMKDYISCEIDRPSGVYFCILLDKAYKAVNSNFAEPDRSANYHLNSPTEMMNLDPLKVWQDKLNYFQYHEAIAADPAQKFSLAQQIEECQRKISELSSMYLAQTQKEILHKLVELVDSDKLNPDQIWFCRASDVPQVDVFKLVGNSPIYAQKTDLNALKESGYLREEDKSYNMYKFVLRRPTGKNPS